MVVPYYFTRWADNYSKDYPQEEVFEAKQRLIEESNASEDTYLKNRKIYPCVPAFLSNICNELKRKLFCKNNV
jgi:hypothetical protein